MNSKDLLFIHEFCQIIIPESRPGYLTTLYPCSEAGWEQSPNTYLKQFRAEDWSRSITMLRCLVFIQTLAIFAHSFPHFSTKIEDSRNFAVFIHRANMEEIMRFQRRIEEETLNRNYGPAFADSYSYEEKMRVANVLQTIRKLHKFGNYQRELFRNNIILK